MTHRRPTVTSNDRGPLIEVSVYLLLSSSILATVIKIITKIIIARKLQGDDWFAISTVIFAIGQSVARLQQVRWGLGQHIHSKTAEEVSAYEKAGYAAELQYILAIALTKMVTLQFLATLARERRKKLYVTAAVSCNAVWALVAFLLIAFQCEAPHVWATTSGACINRPAFWTVLSIIDISIDLAVTALPIFILYTLQVTWARKMNTIVAFGGRILVIPVTIIRLVYIYSSDTSLDPTFDNFNQALTTDIATALSIMVAVISFIKPFLDNIETGGLASKIRNPSSISTPKPSKYMKLEYAKNIFNQQRTLPGGRTPLVTDAQIPWDNRNLNSYELSDIQSGKAQV